MIQICQIQNKICIISVLILLEVDDCFNSGIDDDDGGGGNDYDDGKKL